MTNRLLQRSIVANLERGCSPNTLDNLAAVSDDYLLSIVSMASVTEKFNTLNIGATPASYPSKPTLFGVPAEVKLKIIGRLDPKEIQRARQLSSQFKALVDEHKISLAKPPQDKEIARLKAFLDYHDYTGLSLLEALTRWTDHWGVWDYDIQEYCKAFGRRFLPRQDLACMFHGAEFKKFWGTVVWLLRVHAFTHTKRPDGVRDPNEHHYLDTDLFSVSATLFGLNATEEGMSQIHQDVMAEPPRLSTNVKYTKPRAPFLSSATAWNDEVSRVLDGPSIQDGIFFRYQIGDGDAAEELRQAMMKVAMVDGAAMEPLVKAAMLQKLFIA